MSDVVAYEVPPLSETLETLRVLQVFRELGILTAMRNIEFFGLPKELVEATGGSYEQAKLMEQQYAKRYGITLPDHKEPRQ